MSRLAHARWVLFVFFSDFFEATFIDWSQQVQGSSVSRGFQISSWNAFDRSMLLCHQRCPYQRHIRPATNMEQSHSENINVQESSPTLFVDNEISATADVLLERLDDTFDYEGRLSRGDATLNRCGYVCILGAPNMGKSSLLNALLQEDLCICTSRPQTTRHAILGILSTNHTQVCLIDTPGILETPAYKLQEGMMEAVATAFRDADVLLVVTDLFSTPIPNDLWFRRVQQSAKPVLVVINKIDLLSTVVALKTPASLHSLDADEPAKIAKTTSVEEAVARWRSLLPNALTIVPTCTVQGSKEEDPGVVALRRLLCGGPNVPQALRQLGRPIPGMFPDGFTVNDAMWQDDAIRSLLLPLSPPLYDSDVITDRTERFVASEIIRAAIFTSFHKELPYCCEVQITQFQEPKNAGAGEESIIRIAADIIVERESQKAIVIGKQGAQIKHVGMVARNQLQAFLQEKVHLTLNVKVNKDWRRKEDQLKLYGYFL
jgi:GTPase